MAGDNKKSRTYYFEPEKVNKALGGSPYLSAYVANNILHFNFDENVAAQGKIRTPIEVAKELKEAGIDLLQFDILQSSELDRKLKRSFGYLFLILTLFFTAASYLIVVFNSINGWHIPEKAITALIIETPIQFIGLLYIIARNLFPQGKSKFSEHR